jgi:tetraprenyl-beta-curcumene synthase
MSLTAPLSTRRDRGARQDRSVRLFLDAARRYWVDVFPVVRAAQRRFLARAETIPDPLLRADALTSHRDKGSNSEGLAALAILAPRKHRGAVARSLVAYQLILDYLDGVSERPGTDPLANGLNLHRAFEVALDPEAGEADYYALAVADGDGGYLAELIRTCREPLLDLPSYPAVRDALLRQAGLCRESQALNHALKFTAVEAELDEWSERTAAKVGLDLGFEWWELIAAAAASSLCVGALLALAANPNVDAEDARRVELAYFPWASGLNALLDSLVDLDEDPEEASHLRRYESWEHAAERLRGIAIGARQRVAKLPDGRLHEAILAAMGSLYLVHEEAWSPGREPLAIAVYGALGPLARPSMAVHLMRRPRRGARALLAVVRYTHVHH